MSDKQTAVDMAAYERRRDMEIYVLTYEAFIGKWKPKDPREVDRFAADLANLLRIHLADAQKDIHRVLQTMAEMSRLSSLGLKP